MAIQKSTKQKQKGSGYVFTSGMGLFITLAMVAWIVLIILFKGLSFFWIGDVLSVQLDNGDKYTGELWDEDDNQLQLKIGNRDLYGRDFIWLKKENITEQQYKVDAVTIEREEYGNFYGYVKAFEVNDKRVESNNPDFRDLLADAHDDALQLKDNLEDIQEEATELGEPLTNLLREISLAEIDGLEDTQEGRDKIEDLRKQAAQIEAEITPQMEEYNQKLIELITQDQENIVEVQTAEGQIKTIELSAIVNYFYANDMNIFQKSLTYLAKIWEFIAGFPRESNTEGGVFPAIFGTVLMVLLMSIAVVPFGVLAAIYLNEYAKQGPIVRAIRLSVNNLAGVPSIVFGVFGLGFFVYVLGGSIDALFFSDKLPEPTFGTGGILWASLTLALLTLPVVVVATEEGILAVPRANKEGALALGSTKWQMIRKIVLPNAMPGILTGLILAISRGAGEVAPLMITGVVKLAPSLAIDGIFPFLHLDRKFMHLGFHIYDVGFQSPNVEAAKPMVYSTALLLIIIVILLNIFAIYIRNNLRKKYKTSTF